MTLKDTSDDLFETRFPLPSNSGVRFEKPRNKDWILSPTQKRAAWRRYMRRMAFVGALVLTAPITLEAAGVMPDAVREFACAQISDRQLGVADKWCAQELRLASRD